MKDGILPKITTVREHVAWSYANLARAHTALSDGATSYSMKDHMVRARLFKGLCEGRMNIRSLYDDERLKLMMPRSCVYCGGIGPLTLDHLIPRYSGGRDASDNLVAACRSCNSAKGARDMLSWHLQRNAFPSLMILRRYLKLVADYCAHAELLDSPLSDAEKSTLPFDLKALPYNYPPLNELCLWVSARPEPG